MALRSKNILVSGPMMPKIVRSKALERRLAISIKILRESKRKLVDFTEAERNLALALKEAKLGNFAK